MYAHRSMQLELFKIGLKLWRIISSILTVASLVWSTWMLIRKMPISINGPFLFSLRLILLFYTYPFLFFASAICNFIAIFTKTRKEKASRITIFQLINFSMVALIAMLVLVMAVEFARGLTAGLVFSLLMLDAFWVEFLPSLPMIIGAWILYGKIKTAIDIENEAKSALIICAHSNTS